MREPRHTGKTCLLERGQTEYLHRLSVDADLSARIETVSVAMTLDDTSPTSSRTVPLP